MRPDAGYTVADPPIAAAPLTPDHKSETQHRVERELAGLLDIIVAQDFPFLGACYGVGTLGRHQGALIDRTYGETLGGVTVKLTADGLQDPLLAGLDERFAAFVGHKEACTVLPGNAVLLAGSAACPVQMFRIIPTGDGGRRSFRAMTGSAM